MYSVFELRSTGVAHEIELLAGLLIETQILPEIDFDVAGRIVTALYGAPDLETLYQTPDAVKPRPDGLITDILLNLERQPLPRIPENLIRLALTYQPLPLTDEILVTDPERLTPVMDFLNAMQDEVGGVENHEEAIERWMETELGANVNVVRVTGGPMWAAWPRLPLSLLPGDNSEHIQSPLNLSILASASDIAWTAYGGLLADGHLIKQFSDEDRWVLSRWERALKVHQAVNSARVDLDTDPNGPMFSSLARGARPVPPMPLTERFNVIYGQDDGLHASYALALAAAAEKLGERVYIARSPWYFGRTKAATRKQMRGQARFAPLDGPKLDAFVERLGPGDALVLWHRGEETGPAIMRAVARGARLIVNMRADLKTVEEELDGLRVTQYAAFETVLKTGGLPRYVGYDGDWLLGRKEGWDTRPAWIKEI